MQAKLLRAIQEREIQRVGSDKAIKVDVRIIAATNRNLFDDVHDGKFREDLFYRLNVVNLTVPSLHERNEDIPLLAKHFLESFAQKNRRTMKGFTPTAMDLMVRYPWPGNVRELENALERAVILSLGDYITERELPPSILSHGNGNSEEKISVAGRANMPLEEIEKTAIIQTLKETGGNKSEASRILQITRTTLNNKIKKYRIDPVK
jgi:two-component system response regulator HydG